MILLFGEFSSFSELVDWCMAILFLPQVTEKVVRFLCEQIRVRRPVIRFRSVFHYVEVHWFSFSSCVMSWSRARNVLVHVYVVLIPPC